MADSILSVYSSLTFEGRPINAIDFRGRRCVVAREVGAALGYAQDGKRFATQITGRWSDDMRKGEDYDLLEDDVLAGIKEESTATVPSFVSSCIILYESGVHKALLRTTKPAGVRIRDLLAREVMPQLTRTGEYTPTRTVNAAGDVVDRATGQTVKPATEPAGGFNLRESRERRLADLKKARGLRRAAQIAERRGLKDYADMLWVKEASVLSGEDLTPLLPLDKREEWLSPEEIANLMGPGVFSQTVGRLVTALDLKDDPDHCEAVINKARGHDRQVTSYRYSPEAVARIRRRHLSYLRSSPRRLKTWQDARRLAGLSTSLESFESEVLRELAGAA